MTRTICVYSFLLLLSFLLTHPILGQTVGTLTIMENTRLRDDHEGNIIIRADDVTLDCRGFTVSGTGSGFGILLSEKTGVTVKNCIVKNFARGFFLDSSSGNTLTGNTANDNEVFGFDFSRFSNSNTLAENIANDNDDIGFSVRISSSLNTLRENEGFDNNDFNAEDDGTGVNDWVDNNFGTTSGLP